MPRSSRVTAAGLVYHVTHRGNRRADVFFDREDREVYLRWLAAAGRRHALEVWAFCLMTNHVHLLLRGLRSESLGRALGEVQGRYARRVNEAHGWSGHLWANRFYSHPVAGDGLWAAVRYIERNPVRAGMVTAAEEYPWSSARAHCGLSGPGILAPGRPFPGRVTDWKSWLEVGDESRDEELRTAARTGRPVANAELLDQLESELGRSLRSRPRGRPRRAEGEIAGQGCAAKSDGSEAGAVAGVPNSEAGEALWREGVR